MKDKELALAIKMLEEYSERLSNETCNDWNFPDGWSLSEARKFVQEYHDFNGDPEDYDPLMLTVPNFAVAAFLAHKLAQQGRKD